MYTYSTANGKDGLCDQSNIFEVPQIGCLEEINIGETIFDACLLKSKQNQK